MTISGYSNAIVDAMLGWLKGFANWVLRLFNLAGSVGTSPLLWLSQNWFKLLIILMAIGVITDIVVWLVRWRPHWVWFHKKRVIVDDDRFFSNAQARDEDWDGETMLRKNWQERDFVVASTFVKRGHDAVKPSTVVKRRRKGGSGGDGVSEEAGDSFRHGERRQMDMESRERRIREIENRGRSIRAKREIDLFNMDQDDRDMTDYYEDEVFNLSDLPSPEETGAGERKEDE